MAIKEAGFFGTSAVVSEPTSRVKALPFSTNPEAETTTANLITGGFGIATQIGTMAQDYLVNKTTEEFGKTISDIAIMKSDAEIKAMAGEAFKDRDLTNKLPSTLRFLLAGKEKATALAQHAGNKTMKAAIIKESNDILGVNPIQDFMSKEAVAQRTTQAAAVKSVQDKYKEALKFITPVLTNGTPDVAATVKEYETMQGMLGGLGPIGKSIPKISGVQGGQIRSAVLGQLKSARDVVTKTYSKNLLRLITALGETEPNSPQRVVIARQIRDMNRGITAGIYRNLNSEAQGGGLKFNVQPSEVAFIRANIDNMMTSFSGTTSWEDVKVGKELKQIVAFEENLLKAEIFNTPLLRSIHKLKQSGVDGAAMGFLLNGLDEFKSFLLKAQEEGESGKKAGAKVFELFATNKKIQFDNPLEMALFEQTGTALLKSFSNATSPQKVNIVKAVASVLNNNSRSEEDKEKLITHLNDLDIPAKLGTLYNKAENKEELRTAIVSINTVAQNNLTKSLKNASEFFKQNEKSLSSAFKLNPTTNKIEVIGEIKDANDALKVQQANAFNKTIESISQLNSIITDNTSVDQAKKVIIEKMIKPYFNTEKNKSEDKTKQNKKKSISWQGNKP